MTEESQNNQKTVLIALDIAKKTQDAIIALPSGKTIKLRVPNSLDGYQHLLPLLATEKTLLLSGPGM